MAENKTRTSSDKRKVTSKANMQKARQAKLGKLQKKKEVNENTQKYEIVDNQDYSSSDSDSDTDDEVIIVKGKKNKPIDKSKMNEMDKMNAEINELKNVIQNLTIKKKKKQHQKKQVIKVVNQQPNQPAKPVDPKINGLKERLLINF